MTATRLTVLLGILGLIPFIASSLLVVTGGSFQGIDPRWLFISYSAIILSFLAGTLWGKCLNAGLCAEDRLVLILSNLLAFLAWGGLLLGTSPRMVLIALAAGYIATLWIERRYDHQLAVKPDPGYLVLRMALTGTVVATHLVMLASLGESEPGT